MTPLETIIARVADLKRQTRAIEAKLDRGEALTPPEHALWLAYGRALAAQWRIEQEEA